MCGIAGMYLFKRGDLHERYFSWCLDTMHRRGPDRSRIWQNGNNYISAFARLAIRDLSELGDQPMLSECGQYCVSFNGEIYNTAELLYKLKPYRTHFKSASDTEVLLYALMHLGVDQTLSIADGMFAFAFFDQLRNRLVLARDRVGIKPLYVGLNENAVVYSSQYDHVINHPFFRNQPINGSVIPSYLSLGYMPENTGIVANTYLVPHGHYITVTEGKVTPIQYYAYPIAKHDRRQHLDDALKKSVMEQLVGDVPVGTFLSGGTDSNLVTYFANHQKDFQAFTIGVNDARVDEAPEAKVFAEIFHAQHHCKYIDSADLLGLINENVVAFTEPFADFSSLPTLMLSRFAKEKITVALSGDGGDELFWGYPRSIKALRAIPLYRKTMTGRRIKLLTGKLYNPRTTDITRHWRHRDFIDYYFASLAITGAARWVSEICEESAQPDYFYCKAREEYKEGCTDADLMQIARRMEVDIHLQRILLKVDRASMHYSLEARVPFLSNRMLEFSAAYDYRGCIAGRQGKMPLKNSLAIKTAENLVFRPKKGFTVPIGEWMRMQIRKDVTEKILDMPANLAVYFRKDKLELLLREHMQSRKDWGWMLWALYSLVNWEAAHLNKYAE